MKPGNEVLSSYGTTVFEVFSRLAAEVGAINLGQGFPDDRGPPDVLDEAVDDVPRALAAYTRMRASDAEALVKMSQG